MKKQLTSLFTAFSIFCGSAVSGPLDPVAIDTEGPSIASEDDWKFELRPYLWTVSMEGDMGINGIITPVDLSFKDILENLDFAAAGTFIAQKGKWSAIIDANYLKMSVGINEVPFALFETVGIGVEQLLLGGGIFYRIAEWDSGYLDVGAGVQYMYAKNDFSLRLSPSGVASVSDRLAAEAVDRVAAQIRKEISRQIAGLTPPTLPTGKALDRVVDRIADRVDSRGINEDIRRTLQATTAHLANANLDTAVGGSGEVREQVRALVRARAQERLAATVAGLKSRAAKKAAKLRKQAERKLSRALQKEINDRIPDELSASEGWVDPFVGARMRQNITDRLYVNVFGAYGGFGVGSDKMWQIAVGPGWVVNDWLTLEFFYRHMRVDYENDGFVFDADLTGLFLGAVIQF